MKGFLFAFFQLVLIALAAHPAQAADAVGAVKEIAGSATLAREGAAPAAVKNGDPVYANDVFEMEENTRAVISFSDGAELVISGKGRMTVDKYVYAADQPEENAALIGIFGAAFSYVGGLMDKGKDTDVTLKMDFGSIGIRGTTVYGMMKNGVDWMYLEEGAAMVKNDGGEVALETGYGTSIIGTEESPRPAYFWSEEQINWIKRAVADPSTINAPAMAFNDARKDGETPARKKSARARAQKEAPSESAGGKAGGALGGASAAPAADTVAPAASTPAALDEAKADALADEAPLAKVEAVAEAEEAPPLVLLSLDTLAPEAAGVRLSQGEGGALRIDTQWPVTVNLASADISAHKLEDTALHYEAQLMSPGLSGAAYLEMWVHFPGEKGGYFFSRGLDNMLEGKTAWKTYRTPFFLKKGQRPDKVILNVVIKGEGALFVRGVKLRAVQ